MTSTGLSTEIDTAFEALNDSMMSNRFRDVFDELNEIMTFSLKYELHGPYTNMMRQMLMDVVVSYDAQLPTTIAERNDAQKLFNYTELEQRISNSSGVELLLCAVLMERILTWDRVDQDINGPLARITAEVNHMISWQLLISDRPQTWDVRWILKKYFGAHLAYGEQVCSGGRAEAATFLIELAERLIDCWKRQ